MYGKHFESMYTGSMYGAGVAVFAVWGYVISHARGARVELNPKRLADTLGGKESEIIGAIDFLKAPDPRSRHKEHEGRRLIQEGEYQYFVPTWDDYAAIKDAEALREYFRDRKRAQRERQKKPRRSRSQVSAQYRADEKEFCAAEKSGDTVAMDEISGRAARAIEAAGESNGETCLDQ